MTYDKGAVTFGLVAATVYFLVAFCMYYWIDIKDNKETDYEVKVREWYKGAAGVYRTHMAKIMAKRAQLLMPVNHRVIFEPGVIEHTQKKVEKLFRVVPKELEKSPHSPNNPFRFIFDKDKRTYISIENNSGEMAELFKRIELSIIIGLRSYRWMFWLKTIQIFLTYFVKRFVFVFRNYGFDGLLPIEVAVLALLTTYNIVDLSGLKAIVPSAG